MNVVSPPRSSRRTVVWFSASLKKRSINSSLRDRLEWLLMHASCGTKEADTLGCARSSVNPGRKFRGRIRIAARRERARACEVADLDAIGAHAECTGQNEAQRC